MSGPLVCGVDFSDHSKRALAWARLLADRLARPLVVVHAVEPLLADAARVTYGREALDEAIAPELRAFVGEGPELQVGVGDPARVLHGAALAKGAAMIVVGTQGLGRASRMWFGSTTMQLLRESTIPILGVPPRAPDAPVLSRLVVGTDFSPAADAALAVARDVAHGVLPITCLHVVPTPPAHMRWNDVVAAATDAAVRAARQRLGVAPTGAPADPAFACDVRTGDAAEVLIEAAAGQGALIVVGLGSDEPARRPGTTAYRVISGSDAPVLAVPAVPPATTPAGAPA